MEERRDSFDVFIRIEHKLACGDEEDMGSRLSKGCGGGSQSPNEKRLAKQKKREVEADEKRQRGHCGFIARVGHTSLLCISGIAKDGLQGMKL